MKQINANAPTPGDIMELAKENERLQAQLVNANERANELIERVGEAEAKLVSAAITGSSAYPDDALNKFAIEQQIKALKLRIHDNASYDDFGFNIIYVDDLMDYIEQFESKL